MIAEMNEKSIGTEPADVDYFELGILGLERAHDVQSDGARVQDVHTVGELHGDEETVSSWREANVFFS